MKRTFVHLTFNQVVAGSIPARPTNKNNNLYNSWYMPYFERLNELFSTNDMLELGVGYDFRDFYENK